jgi:hypothetical protein
MTEVPLPRERSHLSLVAATKRLLMESIMAGYGGVRTPDKRKEVAPKASSEKGAVPAAGEDKTAKQESGFTGKRTYESRRPNKDPDEPESQ